MIVIKLTQLLELWTLGFRHLEAAQKEESGRLPGDPEATEKG